LGRGVGGSCVGAAGVGREGGPGSEAGAGAGAGAGALVVVELVGSSAVVIGGFCVVASSGVETGRLIDGDVDIDVEVDV